MDKLEGGYWTDASSIDALSTCSDAEDSVVQRHPQVLTFSPTTPHSTSIDSTPVNPSSAAFYTTPTTAYLVGCESNSELVEALKSLNIKWFSANEQDFAPLSLDSSTTIIVFHDFAGPLFDAVRKRGTRLRIYGPPIVLEVAAVGGTSFPISKSGYPLFSRTLKGCKICATGIRSREELVELRRKILYLDGVFLEREGPVMTHLVAARCRGNKYRDAVALDKPILKPEWVEYLWENRNSKELDVNQNLAKYKVRAFYGARIALDGFDSSERAGMIKLIEENEGINVDLTDPTATHIVKNLQNATEPNIMGVEEISREPSSSFASESQLSEATSPLSPVKRPRFELSVINDEGDFKDNDNRGNRTGPKILKAEWFWSSIQIEACAIEDQYQLVKDFNDDTLNASIGTPNSFTSPGGLFSDTDGGTPLTSFSNSVASRRKRKRNVRDFISQLAQVDNPKCIMEVDEELENLGHLVKSPEQYQDNVTDNELAVILKRVEKGLQSPELKTKLESASGKALKRLNEFAHLVETEKNYVTILMHIMKIFKEPCEQEDQKAGRLLTPLEVKTIFHPILPIYSLHKRLLRDMLHILENYSDESLIGQIYVKNAQELRKCYEPFIEYFETVKNEIIRCESENPRFMAFLRIAQCKPQCGKEKLVELIIRPVQRLPSTALVLKNLEKNTERTNPDYEWITKGVEAIDQVNQAINQRKEKADARMAMFDVYNEMEGCPVEVISNHRSLLKKYDVIALQYDPNANLATNIYKHDSLTLVVFSDHFQVAKRRLASAKNAGSTLSMANLRSPAVTRKSMKFGPSSSNSGQKRYKFLEWINFCHVRKMVNVTDSDPRSFAFIVREPEEPRERVLRFTIPEDVEMEKIQKLSIVEFFAKQVARSLDRVDYEQFVKSSSLSGLALNGNSNNASSGFISRGIKKVGRALSLSRTPSKLKRTMSQLINSPFASRSCHKERDPDTISQSSTEITPMRNHLSSISLFGTKRGPVGVDGQSTPKTRKTFFERDPKPKNSFAAIEET